MREPNQEPAEFSPAAFELMDAWLLSRQIPTEPVSPDVADFVHYQSGAMGADKIRAMEAALVRDPAGRALLKLTRAELETIRRMPWSMVAKLADDRSLKGKVARAWMALTFGAVESAALVRESWRAQGWAAIREQAAAGALAAKTAWASLLSVGDQLRYTIQAAPPAIARSGSEAETRIEGDLPPGMVGALDAEIDEAGSLIAALSIQDADGNVYASLDKSSLHLALLVNGQTWPLASAVVKSGKAAWTLSGIGRALGLASGPLPASFFSISLGEAAQSSVGGPVRLMTEILDAEGRPADRIPVPIEVHEGPTWEGGKFHATIVITGPVLRAYVSYSLNLDVIVAGTARQCLGIWPLSDWGDLPRVITAECPGSPDAAVPFAAVLHATLQP